MILDRERSLYSPVMSRANRRRNASEPAAPAEVRPAATAVATPPRTPEPAPVDGQGWHISWRHCLIGLFAGEALLLVVSNVGLIIANAAFGPSGQSHADGGIVGVATFVAVIAGGYLAARMSGRAGIYQGIVVAVGFILVGAMVQFAGEAQTVHQSLASGSHTLVDLGPMNIGNLVAGDFIALIGGSFGGHLGRRRQPRPVEPGAAIHSRRAVS